MKQTYFGRTPILTLFTFFALALGSQWTFGQVIDEAFDYADQTALDAVWRKHTSSSSCQHQTGYVLTTIASSGTNRGIRTKNPLSFVKDKKYKVEFKYHLASDAQLVASSKIQLKLRTTTAINVETVALEDSDRGSWKSFTGSFTATANLNEEIVLNPYKIVGGVSFDDVKIHEIPTITISSTTVDNGDTTPTDSHNFSFTTSSDTSNFIADDISCTNCTISNFTGSDSTYSATITASSQDAVTLSIAADSFTDSNNIGNLESSFIYSYSAVPCNVTLGDASYSCGQYDEDTDTYSYTATLDVVNSDPSNIYTLSTDAGSLSTDEITANTTTSITVTFSGTTTNSFTLSIDECALVTKNYTTTCNYMIGDDTTGRFWYKDTHWSKGTIPTATDDVIITSRMDFFTNSKDKSKTSTYSAVNSLTIESGAHFQLIEAGDGSYGDATINGDFTNNGTLTIDGDFEASGNITNESTININETAYLSGADIINNGTINIKQDADNSGILKVSGTASGSGTYEYEVSVQAVTAGATTKNVSLIAPPVTGETIADVQANNSNILKQSDLGTGNQILFGPYNPSTDTFSNFTTTSADALTNGQGYRAALFETAGTITFKGGIEVADKTVSGLTAEKFNLVGNPYTTGYSLKGFVTDNSSNLDDLNTAVTYWNASTGGYTTKSQSELNTTDIYLAPAQAFFVKLAATKTSIAFKKGDSQIYQSSPIAPFRSNNEDLSGIGLHISHNDAIKTTKLYFNAAATLGADRGHEAQAFGKAIADFGIYTQLADASRTEALAVQTIPTTGLENTTLKLGINTGLGEHTLSLEGINLSENLNVYVTDLANGSQTLLNKYDYTFNVTAAPLEGADRFLISFQSDALSTGDNALEQLQISAFQNTITVKGDLKNNTNLKVYDLQGRKVAQTALSNNNRELTVNNSVGVYVVNLSNAQGSKTQKVILK